MSSYRVRLELERAESTGWLEWGVAGTHRYFRVQRALMEEPSKFPPSRRSVAFSTTVVGMSGLPHFFSESLTLALGDGEWQVC